MKKVCLALLAISMTPSCFAADHKQWYMGFGMGDSRFTLEDDYAKKEEHDSFITLSGGYNFNEFIALEVGYVDLGKTTFDFSSPNSFALGPDMLDLEAHGFTISSVISWEIIDSLTISGKIGVTVLDLETKFHGGFLLPPPSGYASNKDSTETEFFGGLRISYKINESISFGADWDHYKLDDIDVDSIYGRLGFHF